MKYLIIIVVFFQACYSTPYIDDYNKVPIIYEDIENLSQLLSEHSIEEIDAALVQSKYFDLATLGLKSLIAKDKINSESYAKYVVSNYEFLKSLSGQINFIRADSTYLKSLLRKFSIQFPTARYKPTYFVIGQGMHGGTVTDEGFIIELQKNSLGISGVNFEDTDTTKNSPYKDLDQTWIHEQVHVSRKEQYKSGSLLRMTIDEGSCDFIAYKITGKKSGSEAYRFGEENKVKLFKEWKNDLTKDVNEVRPRWVWNNAVKQEYPPDMGYYIGFKISESFFKNHKDKNKALLEMLEMNSYEEFYKQSNF